MNKEITPNNNLNLATVLSQADLDISFDRTISNAAFAQWVRVLLQNWRQGTVGVKGRSDISRSNKKPWKQKGTGRARAGRASSPLWRGGGVVFGPQMRERTLSIPRVMKKGIMRSLIQQMLTDGRITVLDWHIVDNKPSTKRAAHVLRQVDFLNKKILLLVRPEDLLVQASFINLENVSIACFDQLNVYEGVLAHHWVFLKEDFENFKQMVSQWI